MKTSAPRTVNVKRKQFHFQRKESFATLGGIQSTACFTLKTAASSAWPWPAWELARVGERCNFEKLCLSEETKGKARGVRRN